MKEVQGPVNSIKTVRKGQQHSSVHLKQLLNNDLNGRHLRPNTNACQTSLPVSMLVQETLHKRHLSPAEWRATKRELSEKQPFITRLSEQSRRNLERPALPERKLCVSPRKCVPSRETSSHREQRGSKRGLSSSFGASALRRARLAHQTAPLGRSTGRIMN